MTGTTGERLARGRTHAVATWTVPVAAAGLPVAVLTAPWGALGWAASGAALLALAFVAVLVRRPVLAGLATGVLLGVLVVAVALGAAVLGGLL
ncbi:MAG: hypothetical protein IE926_08010 [Micrococcales bacterium]|nr:hypothetical protein [Micrococcales bacterium]